MERPDEVRARRAQLGLVGGRQLLEETCACSRDLQHHHTPVGLAPSAPDKPPPDESVNERYDAVVSNHESLRERPDRGAHPRRQAHEGEQELVLRWLNAGLTRRALAEGQKRPELVAHLRESLVVGLHVPVLWAAKCIVPRYTELAPWWTVS